ncbi:MAG: DEAD/DEAH box helicase, partial [Candidatus Poribacteria bacterium]
MNDLGHTLDKFQIDAIRALKKGQDVIVGAPTGSGKIRIAESLIQRCLASNNRAIYIPPTNTLSHQRFRDWSHRFGERVGIETRDVSVRSDAPLRIMTNETFRSAIFDHSHSLDAVEYVIFDELQNMTDGVEFLSGTVKQGTAWEECILFAPYHIRFLCLSLPFPNLEALARWLEHVRSHEVIMIRKTDRPIEHACFIEHFGSGTPKTIEQIRASSPEAQKQLLNQPDADVIEFVCTQEELPCLYLCDSHKRCESLAFDYAERGIIPSHPEAVTQYDAICHGRGIVQEREAVRLRDCLASGIAFYHEGLMPSLKAVVEQMLTDGLIQLIFMTETSAVGCDLPVNSVILDGLEKFDGTRLRYLKPQEYHQMVGRGRRAYACVDPFKTDAETVRHIFNGDFQAFDSHLDLSYATILNLYNRLSVASREKGEQEITKLGNWEIDENDTTRNMQHSDWLQKSFRYFQYREQLNQNATPDDNELLPVECIHDQPHLIVEYQQLSEALSPQKTALKKRQRELRRTKRNEKQRVAQALDELKSSIQQLETKRDALLCADCPHRGECMQRSQKLQKAQREANRLTQRKVIDFLTLDEIDRRIAFLKSMGYIQHGQLTPKGSCASQL